MRKIDHDLLTIGCIAAILKDCGKKMTDIIPDFNGKIIADFAEQQDIYKSDEATDEAISQLAIECYNRIKKKLQ